MHALAAAWLTEARAWEKRDRDRASPYECFLQIITTGRRVNVMKIFTRDN